MPGGADAGGDVDQVGVAQGRRGRTEMVRPATGRGRVDHVVLLDGTMSSLVARRRDQCRPDLQAAARDAADQPVAALRGRRAVARLAHDDGRGARARHQPGDPARLRAPRLALPAGRPDLPVRLFARRLCGALAGRGDRPDRAGQGRARDRAGDPRRLPPLRDRPARAGGQGVPRALLPRGGADRDDRGLGHGEGAGAAAAAAVDADRGAARLSLGPSRQAVRHGYHALALDETRSAFAPVLWETHARTGRASISSRCGFAARTATWAGS